MGHRIACAALWLVAVATSGGCSLFPPRPVPLDRPTHVIVAAIDGIRAADIHPSRTPHLALILRDGAYTWNLEVRKPEDRVATYAEALTALPISRRIQMTPAERARRSVFVRCRRAGLRAASVLRSWHELWPLDPEGIRLPASADSPVGAGSAAAAHLLAERPAFLFVELSKGKDKIEDCDAALGKIFAAISQAGIEEQTTVIVVSAGAPRPAWMIRGPGTRHGHELASPVAATDTVATAAELLSLPRQDTLGKIVIGAFRAWSREPMSKGERIVPRGSIRGRVLRPNGKPMANASVLLVKNEPVDGIPERCVDTGREGEFRFDSVPAGKYDYVFVFDNVPGPLRRSLLVRQDFVVKRDETIRPMFHYRRIRGPDKSRPIPPAKAAASFLDDDRIASLVRACRTDFAPPVLAADVLSGRRVRTSLIREWLIGSAQKLRSRLKEDPVDSIMLAEMTDLAAAYDVNRAGGLLTDPEERELRAALKLAAVQLLSAHDRKKLAKNSGAYVPLAVIAGALKPSRLSAKWLGRADAMFKERFTTLIRQAEWAPSSIDHQELCAVLQYALVNRALGCGNYLNEELERVVDLAAVCLTPEQRRPHPSGRAAQPAKELGFLGLAKSAFSDRRLGLRMRALWEMCGSPYWAPRGSQSLLGTLLTAAASPMERTLAPVPSEHLTKTTALLTRQWGTPNEWLVYVSGWDIDLHVGAARLATINSRLLKGQVSLKPHVLRFYTSPGYDYMLLGGRVSHGRRKNLAAYRHVLFNKLTGYLIVSDDLPAGFLSSIEVQAAGAVRREVMVGAGGLEAQILALAAARATRDNTVTFTSMSGRPTMVICPPPAGAKAGAAKLGVWDVTLASLASDISKGSGGTHLVLTTDRGAEFVRLARIPAHVAGNVEDTMMEGSVGVIRRGSTSTDLILIDAAWAQSDDLRLRLRRGRGYVTIHRAGRAWGWSEGPGRQVTVSLGEKGRRRPRLKVDGKSHSLKTMDGRAQFFLRSGPHRFSVQ